MDLKVPKIRGRASFYRRLGIIGSVSTLILSTIWIVLCIVAITYFIADAPYSKTYVNILSPYGLSFSIAYFNADLSHHTQSYLTPAIVCVLIAIYLFLSANLLVASIVTLKEFRHWTETEAIRKCGTYWSVSAIIMGLYELIFAILFFADFITCSMSPFGDYVGSAAITMATLAMKGYLMWLFHMALCSTLFYVHFLDNSICPV